MPVRLAERRQLVAALGVDRGQARGVALLREHHGRAEVLRSMVSMVLSHGALLLVLSYGREAITTKLTKVPRYPPCIMCIMYNTVNTIKYSIIHNTRSPLYYYIRYATATGRWLGPVPPLAGAGYATALHRCERSRGLAALGVDRGQAGVVALPAG